MYKWIGITFLAATVACTAVKTTIHKGNTDTGEDTDTDVVI